MSGRWYARSAFLQTAVSFDNSALFDEDTIENIQMLQIQSYMPVLCWFEKILIIADYCQLFGLLWIMAQPWPWPYLWSDYSQLVVVMNIDIFSTRSAGALVGRSSSLNPRWGSMDNYMQYALWFAIAQFVVFVSIIFLRRRGDRYGQISHDLRHRLIAILILISYLIYLPCALATFRLYYCEQDPYVLSADPNVQCFGTSHIIYFAVCSGLNLPVLFGLPYMIYRYISPTIIYSYETDHEKRLQVWEILQMLHLDDHWLQKQLWLTSSFTKFGAYYRLHMLILKAWMLVIFVFFRFDFRLQSVLATLTSLGFSLYYGFGITTSWKKLLPFRCMKSNLVMLLSFMLMVVNSIFGMFNAFGVRNAITVGSTESYFLWAFSASAAGLAVAIMVYQVAMSQVYDWPSVHTLNRIWHNEELVAKVAYWVESMRESMLVKADFLLAAVEVADIDALEECIRVLRSCWLSARSVGSLFEVPLSEFLEELLYIHATRLPAALRKHPYWNNEYIKPEVRAVLHKRYYDHSIMAPKKRRVLFKLLAIRYMQGDRGRFSMDVAKQQARQDELDREERARHEAELMALIERRKKEMLDAALNGREGKMGGFANFANNAQFMLFGGAAGASGDKSGEQGGISADELARMEAGGGAGADGMGLHAPKDEDEEARAALLGADNTAGGEDEEEGKGRFPEQDMEEARKMIARLVERTELALNKHHHAKINMIAQENKAMSDAIALNSSSVNLVGNGLNKISTMELIKETVDIEEQNDLEELYFLWDEAIQLYELEEFPGDYDELNKSAENWYTYRGLVTQRLEVVARTLHERDYESLIDGQEVIEEGEESDEEENVKTKGGKGPGNISPRLQQLQQLSARALVPKKPASASSLDDLFGANV